MIEKEFQLPKGVYPMTRSFTALAATLLLTAPLAAADKPRTEVQITWHGQSWFEITSSKGTNIVIDPHAIIEYGPITGVRAHLILSTHFHNDHTQYQVIENFEKPLGKKWPKPEVINGLKREGGRETWNKVDKQFRDVHIRSVPTFHDTESGLSKGKNTVFVLELDGIRVVHLGDLGHKLTRPQIKAIGPVDVLLIPVGGVYTINGSEAKEVVEQLKPKKYIIPMHCATRVYEDLLSVKEFLEDQKKENVARSADNTLVVKTDFKPPSPIIVVLNWEAAPKKKKRMK
jgi:L-ascorbate metabolism protein UlaG (beta-lactamase superfamily)